MSKGERNVMDTTTLRARASIHLIPTDNGLTSGRVAKVLVLICGIARMEGTATYFDANYSFRKFPLYRQLLIAYLDAD